MPPQMLKPIEGRYTFGHTFVAFDNRLGEFVPNCDVALKVDMTMFENYMRKCMQHSVGKQK